MSDWKPKTFVPDSETWQPKTFVPDEPTDQEKLRAVGHGATSGVTLGFADELGAMMTAAHQAGNQAGHKILPKAYAEWFAKNIPGYVPIATDAAGNEMSPTEIYRERRDGNRLQEDQIRKRAPNYYTAGEVGGGIVSGLAIPGGAAKSLAGAAKAGLGYGAAAGLGGGRADLANGEVGGVALDATKGAAAGLAGGTAGYGVAKAVGAAAGVAGRPIATARDKLYEYMKRAAEERAYKASGPMLKDYRIASEQSPDKMREIGRMLLDEDVVGFGRNIEGVAKKIGPVQDRAGRAVGDAIDALDAELIKVSPGAGFLPREIANRINREVAQPGAVFPANRDVAAKISEEAAAIADLPDALTFKGAEALKNSYNAKAKFDQSRPSEMIEGYQDVRRVIKDQVERGADRLNPALGKQFRDAKERFGLIAPAAKTAEDQYLRREANRHLSPTDYLAGLGQMAAGADGLKALIVAWFHKQVRERGAGTMAVTADKISRIMARDPAKTSRVLSALNAAAERGPATLLATKIQLLKDPEMRAILADLEPGAELRIASGE